MQQQQQQQTNQILLLIILVLFLFIVLSEGTNRLGLSVNNDDGSYVVLVDGSAWLTSTYLGFRHAEQWFSTLDGTLSLISYSQFVKNFFILNLLLKPQGLRN